MAISDLLNQFSTDLAADITAIRSALKSKGVDAETAKLTEIADKITSIPKTYTGTISITYPTAWMSGYIWYKKKGVSGAANSIVCNGSGKATITVTEPGTYVVTNSHQEEDNFEVTFNA